MSKSTQSVWDCRLGNCSLLHMHCVSRGQETWVSTAYLLDFLNTPHLENFRCDWPWTLHAAVDDFELLIFLPLPPDPGLQICVTTPSSENFLECISHFWYVWFSDIQSLFIEHLPTITMKATCREGRMGESMHALRELCTRGGCRYMCARVQLIQLNSLL